MTSKGKYVAWLDAYVCNPGNKEALETFDKEFPKSAVFTDVDECKRYIERATPNSVVLMVSGGLGVTFVPVHVGDENLRSVIVYCQDVTGHKKWADKYDKVKLVTSRFKDAIAQIKSSMES